MKPVRLISTAALLLLLGAVAPAYAQQDQHQKDGNAPKQEQQAKPEKQQQQHGQQQKQTQQHQAQQHQQDQNKAQQQQAQQHQAQQHQQDQNKQQQQAQQQQHQAQQHQQDQNKQQQQQAQQHQAQQHQQQANRPSQQGQHGQPGQQRAVWQQHRAHNWQSEHRDWRQRGGYNGYRIPDDRYRGSFGPSHRFRIYRYRLVVVGGYPRFRYGGFWFSVLDPWPEYWSDDWYDNDDVYIDYTDDGYYMYNRRYPGDRIAIVVSVN